jgi:putative transposase
MPNHVHLVLAPEDETGLARAIGAAHRRYTHFINARGRWTGHLFQSRFASVVMDEAHLMTAVRYVSLNPVRAKLVARAEDWPWSSVCAHLKREDDGLVNVKPVLARVSNFAGLIAAESDESFAALRASEGTGRPLGNAEFIAGLERILGRRLAKRAPGRKATIRDSGQGVLL